MKHSAVLLAAMVLLTARFPAQAEVFVLVNEGRVVGELVNPDENPREKFVVRTASGGQITLAKSQVKQILRARDEIVEYEKIRRAYPDTVEGQWALSQWCLEKKLLSQRQKHLRRIIEIDPDHAEARRLLKYSRTNGKWMTRDELMTSQGFVKYKNGEYLLPQQIEILEKKQDSAETERAWFKKIKRWRNWLGTDRDQLARKSILEIDDPYAARALVQGLKTDRVPVVRLLYIESLANIGTPGALEALAVCSIEDPVEEVRLTCLDFLIKKNTPGVIDYYVGMLRSKDNRIVNRSGSCLGELNATTAILPLIHALVTVHKFKVTTGKPGGMSAGFPTGGSGGGGGGLSMGSSTKIIANHMNNPSVLESLVKITGKNFLYNEKAWKNWYATETNSGTFDSRRD